MSFYLGTKIKIFDRVRAKDSSNNFFKNERPPIGSLIFHKIHRTWGGTDKGLCIATLLVRVSGA
jgi:hypothetical protein